jgi:hypothetical protein
MRLHHNRAGTNLLVARTIVTSTAADVSTAVVVVVVAATSVEGVVLSFTCNDPSAAMTPLDTNRFEI